MGEKWVRACQAQIGVPPAPPLLHTLLCTRLFLAFSHQNYHLALCLHLHDIVIPGASVDVELGSEACPRMIAGELCGFVPSCRTGGVGGERTCMFSLLPSILWIIYLLISFFAFTLSNYGVSLCRRLVIGKLVYKSVTSSSLKVFFPLSHRKERQRREKE